MKSFAEFEGQVGLNIITSVECWYHATVISGIQFQCFFVTYLLLIKFY